MGGLIRFALSQRILILLAVFLLAGGGYYAFKNIPIDAFPEVSPTQVKIIVKAPGMTPEEVEAQDYRTYRSRSAGHFASNHAAFHCQICVN